MVKCLKLKKQFGQSAKQWLLKKKWLDRERIVGRTTKYLFLPLVDDANPKQILKEFTGTIEERNLINVKKRAVSLKQALEQIIPGRSEEMSRSFDVVGDIAVLEIPKELEKMEKSIAWTLKRTHPNIKVVAKKAGITEGEFRVRKIEVIIGKDRSNTLHREYGALMKVDLNRAYFSPRLGNERQRIAKQVKKGEKVLVMFAGIGPFPLVIARAQAESEIWGVEINPSAVKLFKDNIKRNKLADRITAIGGDVRKEVPKLKQKFDRIVMVLPAKAEQFLDVAFKVAKKGAIIHVYQFASEKEIPKKVSEKINKEAVKLKKKIKILDVVTCGNYAPRVHRVCLDIKVL